MKNADQFPDHLTQNEKLPIRIVSPGFGHLSPDVAARQDLINRKPYYFFLFMLEGSTRHTVDLEQFDIQANELLFVLPHQVHELPVNNHGTDYFKIGFDEQCLSLLPKQYPFLINPLNAQKINFKPPATTRLKAIFEILLGLLGSMDTDPELILAHLNSLLTEINTAYFTVGKKPTDERLEKYIGFKVFVENNLTEHPAISDIAAELALNTNSLYTLVKHYSGLSPKEFITNGAHS